MADSNTTVADRVEAARRTFGDALSIRVNMDMRLGDIPVQTLREAMTEAIAAYERMKWMEAVNGGI